MKIAATILSLLLLSGCSSMNQKGRGETQLRISQQFLGQPLDSFFSRYGAPYSTTALPEGFALHEWQSDVTVVTTPGITTMQGQIIGNTYTGTATHLPGGSITTFCRVMLKSDPQSRIVQIAITADTIGNWWFSRCQEVL